MTPENQAFIDAYCLNVGHASRAEITDWMTRYLLGEVPNTPHAISIIDSLMMWNAAIGAYKALQKS